ncbi:MAG: Gfo/Idh/MocA family protein [Pseudomonadota bacterium]|jgi:predicted dehydrogenase
MTITSAGEAQLGVCVVGLGHWGPNLVRAIERYPNAKVVVAADPSEDRRKLIAERIPGLPLESTFEACLTRYNFDAVVIAVPTGAHYQLGMQALDAGKHVFIEKPLADSSQAAQELCRKAEQMGRTLMTGHVFLFNQAVQHVSEMVQRGDLGNLFYIHALRTNLGPIRSDVNALWDLASHDISIFNYVFKALPMQVTCSAYSLLGRSVEDIAQGSLLYPGNRVATFFVSWLDPQKKREVTIVGDRKMLIFDDMRPEKPIKVFDKGVTVSKPDEYADTFNSFRMSIREGQVIEPDITTGEPLVNECAHFLDCVKHSTTPITDGRLGADVVAILEALSRSALEKGRPVDIWHAAGKR